MNILKVIKPAVVKYESEILLMTGVSGMIFSTIWGIKATNRAVRVIDLKKQELNKKTLTFKEMFQTTWKLYLPVVVSTAVSVPCIILSNKVTNRKNMALATALTLSETALQEHREKTKELLGEKRYNSLQESMSADTVNKSYNSGIQNVTIIGDGDSLFYDSLSGRYFRTNWNRVSKAANELNARALSSLSGYITLGEWYDILGLPSTALDDLLGWRVTDGRDGIIAISFDSVSTPDNQPCGAIRYDNMPKHL
jgi:hypothetical protein